MSIKTDVQELDSIKTEIKALQSRIKNLRVREKAVSEKISVYLKANDAPGVKHQGVAIVIEEKETRLKKKASEKDIDALEVLKNHGIQDAEKILQELLESRKGALDPVPKAKLKVKKYST